MLRTAILIGLLVAFVSIAVSLGIDRSRHFERLDAEAYREAILEIETVLYRSSPAEFGDGDRVAEAAQSLSLAISERDGTFVTRQRARSLYELIGLASGMSDAGYALPDLASLRGEWEKQREALFEPAPWFGHSATSLVAAQTSRPTAVDPARVTRLRHTVRRLERLADAGEAEVNALGEPHYAIEAPSAARRAQIERWNAWARRWNERIDDALRELPPQPPFDTETALVLAHQNTTRAANELRFVPEGAGDWPTPFRAQWQSRFSEARRLLAELRSALVNVSD